MAELGATRNGADALTALVSVSKSGGMKNLIKRQRA
jgi:hypothetical protein